MRYPKFAAALKRYGAIKDIQVKLGFSRTQVFQYLAGRSLPRAEKLLAHPDLLEAARQDIQEAAPTELAAA